MPPLEFDDLTLALGALPSPPDARDHQVPLDTAVALPPRWIIGPDTPVSMAPVTSQLGPPVLPECGGYTGIDVVRYLGKVEGKGVLNLDPHWLYRRSRTRLGFTPIPAEGTTARAVLETLRKEGVPIAGRSDAALHRIGSYGALPFAAAAIKVALVQYRTPVVLGIGWPDNWFHPIGGIQPKPSGRLAGGHLLEAIGYSDVVAGGSALLQNHWRATWGQGGRAWFPWRYLLPLVHDAWKVLPAGVSVRPI
jgi:hypothetical protein